MIKNLPQIVLLNIVGLALFLSWYIPVNHGIGAHSSSLPLFHGVFFVYLLTV